MARSVAIRLGVEGAAQVKTTFDDVANSGDASAKRWARAYERASEDAQAAMQRQANAAAKIAAIMPQTAVQMRIEDANSTGFGQWENSAKASAAAFRELWAEQERVERQATASRAALAALDAQLSSRGLGNAAQSAAVFAQHFEDLENRARALRVAIDPVAAAQDRFNAEMSEARTLIGAGVISLDDYCDKLRLERSLLDQANQAHSRGGVSVGQMRAATQQITYNIGDFATQLSMGSGVLQAFSGQALQTVGAIGMMSNSTSGFIGFMTGPWGAVITGGAVLLATLAGKYLDGSEAAKEKAKAAQELTEQMDRLAESNMRAVKSEQRLQQETLNTAFAMWKKAEATRIATQEKIKETIAGLRASQAIPSEGGGEGQTGANAARGVLIGMRARQIQALEGQLAANNQEVSKQWASVQAARIPILQGIASESDKATASTRRFDRAVDALNDRLQAGKISGAAYAAEHARLKKVHDDEQETLSKSETKRRGLTDAQRAARKAERDAAADAREYKSNLEGLQNAYDPLTAAIRRYRAELEKIAALRGDDAKSADMFKAGAFEKYAKERAALLGDVIGIDGIRKEANDNEQRQQRAKSMLADQEDALAVAERERLLLGSSAELREQQVQKLQLILRLKRDGITEDMAEFEQIMANNDALAAMEAEMRRVAAATDELRGFGVEFVDTVLSEDTWSSWGNAGKTILNMLKAEFLKLALLNPIKNLINGDSALPTLTSAFKGIGKLFGKNAAGTEWWSGGMSLVGEHGPEIVSMPQGARVTPAGETRRLMQASAQQIQLTVRVAANDYFDARVESISGAQLQMAAPSIAAGAAQTASAQDARRRNRRLPGG